MAIGTTSSYIVGLYTLSNNFITLRIDKMIALTQVITDTMISVRDLNNPAIKF